jgi:hypothetical protein
MAARIEKIGPATSVGPLIDRLDRLLVGVDREAVFVDDRFCRRHGRTPAGPRRRSTHPLHPPIRPTRSELCLHRRIEAVVNVLVARDLYVMTQMWLFAGAGGALVDALLNYSFTSMFIWGRRLS